MISIVTQAASKARAASAKKVTAAHVKAVVEGEPQFDFLEEIISKVPDAPAAKRDEDSEGAEGKKAKGKRRKKQEGIGSRNCFNGNPCMILALVAEMD